MQGNLKMADDGEEKTFRDLKFRIRETLRDRLVSEAEANDRSLNAEIVARLEASLDGPPEMGMDGAAKAIGAILSNVIWSAGHQASLHSTGTAEGVNSWADNPYAYDQACRAVAVALDKLRPPGSPKIEDWVETLPKDSVLRTIVVDGKNDFFERVGRSAAVKIIENIASADATSSYSEKRDLRLKELLGPQFADRLNNVTSGIVPVRAREGKQS
jgi:hypothetical protein